MQSRLELGVYTPAQAAWLTGVHDASAVVRWVFGSGASEPAIIPRATKSNNGLLSFVDLIQVRAIRHVRAKTKKRPAVSLQKVRIAVEMAAKKGVLYPFARQHTIYEYDGEIVLRLEGENYEFATGPYKKEALLEDIAAFYADDLSYGSDGLANRLTPIVKRNRSVVLDPSLRFGAPTVLPCNYSVATLAQAAAVQGCTSAAKTFQVSKADVKLAMDYDAMPWREAA